MSCLIERPRRLRRSAVVRELVAETELAARHLMMPHFVIPGEAEVSPVAAMPGIERTSIDLLVRRVEADLAVGLRHVILFGVPAPEHKDSRATAAMGEQALVPRAVKALKRAFGDDVWVTTDVCLCAYMDHGHCGVLRGAHVDNDATLELLCQMAAAHAQAGADMVAPSDMMDGRVGAMRQHLDGLGLTEVALMAYTAKYASAYYGPFRQAAASPPSHGDRRGYQMDPRNRREAEREARLDAAEGADVLMVKPALAYLDVLSAVRAHSDVPVACFNVSGEYSMVKAAAAQGLLDERGVIMENLLGMRRAGADIIITYHGREALCGGWL